MQNFISGTGNDNYVENNKMKAIYKKELKSYFLTLVGYIFVGVFLLISGYYYVNYNVFAENSDIGVMLENTIISFLFLVPVLTMRLYAEEKHLKTNITYMSAPITSWQIVIGKFVAAVTVFTSALLLNSFSGLYMLVTGGINLGELFCSYIGFWLIGSLFISIGLFMSSLTQSQIVSAISTFTVVLLLYLASWLLDVTTNTVLVFIIKMFSVTYWYENFLYGILDIPAILYFIGFSALFLLLTVFKTESERWV